MNKALSIAACILVVGSASVTAETYHWIFVDTPIHPIAAQYIKEGIDRAKSEHAQALILQLDTPGGLISSTDTIIKDILNAGIPVIGYVAPSGARAASAGFYILMATDVAAMAPGTRTGSSTPILGGSGGGEKEESKDQESLRRKIMNDLIALTKSMTQRRGRNTDLAIKTITEALSFEEKEALEKHLVEIIAKDLDDLLGQLDGKEITLWNGSKVTLHAQQPVIARFPMGFRYRFLSFLMDPNILFILLTLGMLGIYIEMTHPGLILPGLVGVVCLILALMSTQVLPINWGAVALIALAFGMFLLEIKVTSYGLLTVGGIVLLTLGGLMLTRSPLGEWQVSRPFLFTFVFILAAFVALILWFVVRAHRTKPATGEEGMIGQIGWAESDLNPGAPGWVFAEGTLWQAQATSPVKKGQRVRVTRIEPGMVLVVEPLETSPSQTQNPTPQEASE